MLSFCQQGIGEGEEEEDKEEEDGDDADEDEEGGAATPVAEPPGEDAFAAAAAAAASATASSAASLTPGMQALAEATGAAAAAAADAVSAARDKANSVTHKNAYDRFLRRSMSKKHFKPSLSGDSGERQMSAVLSLRHLWPSFSPQPCSAVGGGQPLPAHASDFGRQACLSIHIGEMLRDRNELFNVWLEAGEDFAKVELHYERQRKREDRLDGGSLPVLRNVFFQSKSSDMLMTLLKNGQCHPTYRGRPAMVDPPRVHGWCPPLSGKALVSYQTLYSNKPGYNCLQRSAVASDWSPRRRGILRACTQGSVIIALRSLIL